MPASWQTAPVTSNRKTKQQESARDQAARLRLQVTRQNAVNIALMAQLNPTLSAEALVAADAVGLVAEDPLVGDLANREMDQSGFFGSMANAFDEAVWDPVKGATRWVGMGFEGVYDEILSRPLRTATNMVSHGMDLETAYRNSGDAAFGAFGEALQTTAGALGQGQFKEAFGLEGNVLNTGGGIFAGANLSEEVQYQLALLEQNASSPDHWGAPNEAVATWGSENYGNNFAKLSENQRRMMYLSGERERIMHDASTPGNDLYASQEQFGKPFVEKIRTEAEGVLWYTHGLGGMNTQDSGLGVFTQVSPGRILSALMVEPGTKPFHYTSGSVDLFTQIFGDPADVGLGAVARSVKASRALGMTPEAADLMKAAQDTENILDESLAARKVIEESGDLATLSEKADVTQGFADVLGKEGRADVSTRQNAGQVELQRLGRQRAEAARLDAAIPELQAAPTIKQRLAEQAGMLDGAPRKDVDPFKVSQFITGKGAMPFVDNFVRAKTLRQIDALLSYMKTPPPRSLRKALLKADNNADVVGALLPHMSDGVITESGLAVIPSLTSGAKASPMGKFANALGARGDEYFASHGFRTHAKMQYGGSALARRFAQVAPKTLDLNNLDKTYDDLILLSDNLANQRGQELTYKIRGREYTETADDIFNEFLDLRQGDTVGAYDILTRFMQYSFVNLSARGVDENIAHALTQIMGNMADDSLWFTNRVGDIVREPNAATRTAVGAQEVLNPGPQLLTELFNGTVMFPDHNLIRRAVNETDKFGRVMNSLALQGPMTMKTKAGRVRRTRDQLDDFNQRALLRAADTVITNVWKPLVLLRFAWPFRVIGEEQTRLAAAGLGGALTFAPGSGHHPISYIAMAMSDIGKKDGDVALRFLDVFGDDITKTEEFLSAMSRRANFDGEIGAVGSRYWTTVEKFDRAGNISPAYLDGMVTELNQLWSDPIIQRMFMDGVDDVAKADDVVRLGDALEEARGMDPIQLDRNAEFFRRDAAGRPIIEGRDTIQDVPFFRSEAIRQGESIDAAGRADYTSSRQYTLKDGSFVEIETAMVDGKPFAIARDENGEIISSYFDGMAGTDEAFEGQGIFTEMVKDLRTNQGMTKADFANQALSEGAAIAGRRAFAQPTRLKDFTEAPRKLGPKTGTFDTRPAVLPMDDIMDLREYDRAASAAAWDSADDVLPGVEGTNRSGETIAYWEQRFEGKTPDQIFNELGEADLPILQMDYHGNVVLIEGNHRIAAAYQAGLTEFPVRMVTARNPARSLVDEATMDSKKLPVKHIDDIQPGAMDRLREQYPGFKEGASDTYVPADISPGDVFAPAKAPIASFDEASLSDDVAEELQFYRDSLHDLEIERAGGASGVIDFIETSEEARLLDEDVLGDINPKMMDMDEQFTWYRNKIEEITGIADEGVEEASSVARGIAEETPTRVEMSAAQRLVADNDRITQTIAWMRSEEGSYWLHELTRTASPEYKALLETDDGLRAYLEGAYARAHLKAGGAYIYIRPDGTYLDDSDVMHELTEAQKKLYINRQGYVVTRPGDQRIVDAYSNGKLGDSNVRRRFVGSDGEKQAAKADRKTMTDVREVKRQIKEIVASEAENGRNFPTAVKSNRYLQNDMNAGKGTYDRALNNLFDFFMTKPTNRLSRSPAFRDVYWQRMGELLPHMDEATQAKVIEAATKAKMDTIMMGRRGSVREGIRKTAGEGAGMTSMAEADQLAKAYALTEVQDLLYDLSKKHNISESMRIIFPFIEAYGEVTSTWSKLMTEQWGRPFRRFQQTIQGGRESNFWDSESGYTNNGFFHEDSFGNEVFSASFNVPGAVFGTEEATLNFSLEGMNFLSSVIPGFGPAIQIPANMFLPDSPEWDPVRDMINPFSSGDGNLMTSTLPSWMKRGLSAFEIGRSLTGSDDEARMFENAVIDIMRAKAIQDPEAFKERMGDAVENPKLLQEARDEARNLYLFRSFATFIGPTSPAFEFQAEDENGQLWAYGSLAQMYYKLKEEADGDDLIATEQFDKYFGLDPAALSIGKTKEIYPRSITQKGNAFQRSNPDLFESYKGTAFYLGPATLEDYSPFFYDAYYDGISDGSRTPLNQEQWTLLVNDFYGELSFDTAAKRKMREEGVYEWSSLSDKGKGELRDWRIHLQGAFPGYTYEFGADVPGIPGRISTSAQVAEIYKMVGDKELVGKYEAAQGAERYLQYREIAMKALRLLGFDDFQSAKKDERAVALRAWLRTQGQATVDMYGEFGPMWSDIFAREVAEAQDDIDYELVLEQMAGGT